MDADLAEGGRPVEVERKAQSSVDEDPPARTALSREADSRRKRFFLKGNFKREPSGGRKESLSLV
jgi:hypothetical protein